MMRRSWQWVLLLWLSCMQLLVQPWMQPWAPVQLFTPRRPSSSRPFIPHRPMALLHASSFSSSSSSSSIDLEDEGYRHLEREFSALTQSSPDKLLSFEQFLSWAEIQALIVDMRVTENEVRALWEGVLGNVEEPTDCEGFIRVNEAIDDLFEIGSPTSLWPL